MNTQTSADASMGQPGWEWRKPSLAALLRSLGPDIKDWYHWTVGTRRRRFTAIALLVTAILSLYIFRHVLFQPLSYNLRIYAMVIGLVLMTAVGGWYVVGRRGVPCAGSKRAVLSQEWEGGRLARHWRRRR